MISWGEEEEGKGIWWGIKWELQASQGKDGQLQALVLADQNNCITTFRLASIVSRCIESVSIIVR
jgi:hypothetical protein